MLCNVCCFRIFKVNLCCVCRNYNYFVVGLYLGVDFINKFNLVVINNFIVFKMSLWFWMIYGDIVIFYIYDVMIGNWRFFSVD